MFLCKNCFFWFGEVVFYKYFCSMNNKQIPADKFLDELDFESSLQICDQLIDSMIVSNPTRKDMSRADWLTVIYNDYVAELSDSGVSFIPKD